MQQLPLSGIRVVEFCTAWHGPHVGQWLAVMGAEVIKIESRIRPDLTRSLFTPGRVRTGANLSIENAMFNYSKKDVTLNLTTARGRELAQEIIKHSDIVVDNYSGTAMQEWGLDYLRLKGIKPDIIVYSGSGFGRTGPYKDIAAFAPQVEAFTGLYSASGYLDSPPLMMSYGWTDIVAALHGVYAILAALYHRTATGDGQYIDLAMSEAGAAPLPEMLMEYTINQRQLEKMGNRDQVMAPHGVYRCRGDDKWATIAIASDRDWQALAEVMGNPEWTRDERFSDSLGRHRHQDELDKLITTWTLDHDHHQVMSRLQSVGIMAAASLDITEVVADPQLNARGAFIDMEHAEMGDLHLMGLPWHLSDGPQGNYQPPPLLGEHNEYVFGQLLGLSTAEIDRLTAEKVIY